MPSDFISLRKDQLLYQISEAREAGEESQFTWLRSQWVHRYGLKSLPEQNQLESLFKEEKELSTTNESINIDPTSKN